MYNKRNIERRKRIKEKLSGLTGKTSFETTWEEFDDINIPKK
jgi:hypothetical protein